MAGSHVAASLHLGIEFDIAGQTHYGWIEIESSDQGVRAFIHRWAYETEPGVAILTGVPEPGTGLLAIIGLFVLEWRRRR